MTRIGPDFSDGYKWIKGAMTESGVIYCPPGDRRRGILKIDTNADTAIELNVNLLPERGHWMWMSCAVALDGCMYFMPYQARRIMKLDPNNHDAISSVGDDLGSKYTFKYVGTVVGIDGCVYGLPSHSKRIAKYDPINDTTSFIIGEEADYFHCRGNGVLGRDGCIYALAEGGQILKIDTANNNNSHSFVGNSIQSDKHGLWSWGDPILGIDGCIYWAPSMARSTLKYDPPSNQSSLVGGDFGNVPRKWYGGALATDGVIYSIPSSANRILVIDPLRELSVVMKTNMEEHPEELGFLFRINGIDTASNRTYFDCAAAKFGTQKVLDIVQEHMSPANEVCDVSSLYPFMIAASYEEIPLSVVYLLLRHVPFLVKL